MNLSVLRRTHLFGPEMTPDEILERRSAVLRAVALVKEEAAAFDAAMIEWMNEHRVVSLEMGDKIVTVTRPKKTRCLSSRKAASAVFSASGGDVEALLSCLGANAIKPGAARTILSPDVWDENFEVTVDEKLKIAEIPKGLLKGRCKGSTGDSK